MSTDALQDMYNNSAYDALVDEASKDSRVGDHDFLVTKRVEDTWPSGDPRLKLSGQLITARNAKADLTWSPPPPPEVWAAEKATNDPGKNRAIANAVTLARQAFKHYQKGITQFQEGEVIRVKTGKSRTDADGKGGFIRIIAILPKAGETNGSAPAGNPGF